MLIEYRKTPSSWRLLKYLIRAIPLSNAAGILVERQLIAIIRRTLEEALKTGRSDASAESALESSRTGQETVKRSKKRRRSGELITKPGNQECNGLSALLDAVYLVLNTVVQFTKSGSLEQGQSTEFAAEYMKTVLRTSAEEAATVLGLWLSLCHSALLDSKDVVFVEFWLSPFIKIWNLRSADDLPHLKFALHATQPLLLLLGTLKAGQTHPDVHSWVGQLEKLLAQNVVIPAKGTPDLLETLTKATVVHDVENAPLILDVAIRSVRPTGSARRRKAQDEKFLQSVFAFLKDSVTQTEEHSGKQICTMLRLAINHKLVLDLETLRSIAEVTRADWDILATLIELDANVFLIGAEGKDTPLLDNLLEEITRASESRDWPNFREKIVTTILKPLIRSFAKARDLPGFVRYWFVQLVQLHRRRGEMADELGAWEDDDLLSEFGALMQAHMEPKQLLNVLEGLEMKSHPNAAVIILEAIAAAIDGEERWVDEVLSQLYLIIGENAFKLEDRYKFRTWRILSYTMCWIENEHITKLSEIWRKQAAPFDAIPRFSTAKSLVGKGGKGGLEALEFFRFACSAWTARIREDGNGIRDLVKPVLLGFFSALSRDVKRFTKSLQEDEYLGDDICGSKQNTVHRDTGWLIWSLARCLFVDHPDVLV